MAETITLASSMPASMILSLMATICHPVYIMSRWKLAAVANPSR